MDGKTEAFGDRNEDTRESDAFYDAVTAVREALRGRAAPVGEGGARLAETS